jgi:hypothetical protein
MRHIPSEKMLRKVFGDTLDKTRPWGSQEGVKQLRQVLVRWRDREIKSREMLKEADRILQGFGIEYIRSARDDVYDAHGAYYVNQGDTYVPTILLDLDRNRVWATSWGDWVEAEERQGKRFP